MSRPRIKVRPSYTEMCRTFRYDPETGCVFRLPRFGDTPSVREYNRKHCVLRAGGLTSVGYRAISYKGQTILEHRLAWLLTHYDWPPEEIDHIDGDKTNNKLANLRSSSRSQNIVNGPARHASGWKGVSFIQGNGTNPWRAKIAVNKNQVHLGNYATRALAAEAYARAARFYYNDFAFTPRGSINATINIAATIH